ncbi:BTAD domain-containing putative transcriptional regulator [Streptomyces sp. WAC06614]|uniref:AfsR/SARP family transcriptional regulator n=1 Tax=Streptomyces sp. WAC06614 TaxID=2487416 RepID=UPI000F777F01|nr:BTAD domain-containing putative transcriptional regulator [Streptomyces sp. WAC06614]RSS83737.1 SARP family transcriptional regulator [Streptomyces sp. WAC06614]
MLDSRPSDGLLLLLGPVELRAPDGELVDIGGPKRRALLATLAVEMPRPVSVDRLMDLVWDGRPPPRARAALHGHVAALRKVLPAAFTLETVQDGYRLLGNRESVDSHVFERLAAEAAAEPAPAARSRLLEEALGLWRGSPASDLPPGHVQHLLFVRLCGPRKDLGLAWAECELALGTGGRAVPLLETALRADGLQEDFAATLVRCLHQAGRQADAVEVYQRTARQLRDELGVRPGPPLRQALAEVLADDGLPAAAPAAVRAPAPVLPPSPVPAPPAAVGPLHQLPRPVGGFVGREEERRWLDRAVGLTGAGGPVLAVVEGSAGVGKTALVVQWAHGAAARFPDGLLFADLRGFDEREPAQVPSVLAGLLRALGREEAALPAGTQERSALFRRLTRQSRLLLVLDNVPAEADLGPLLPDGADCVTVVTSRAALPGLADRYAAVRRTLQALPAEDAVCVLSASLGAARIAAEPGNALRLVELCDRLPLALRIAAARLTVRPDWSLAHLIDEIEDERGRLDGLDTPGGNGVRAALELTRRRLDGISARLFALLGLYPGDEIETEQAMALLGADRQLARMALGNLAAGHLLAEVRPGRYARPTLLRLYGRRVLTEQTAPEEAAQAFRRLLDHCAERTAAAAAPLGPLELLLLEPSRADAGSGGWFEEEEPALRALVDDAALRGEHPYVWRLADSLSLFYSCARASGHWVRVARTGLRAAEVRGDADAAARMRGHLGTALTRTGRPQDGLPHLEAALAAASAAEDVRGRLTARIRLALCHERLGRPRSEIREAFTAAARIANEVCDIAVTEALRRHRSRADGLPGGTWSGYGNHVVGHGTPRGTAPAGQYRDDTVL